jgi:hypothetical protein
MMLPAGIAKNDVIAGNSIKNNVPDRYIKNDVDPRETDADLATSKTMFPAMGTQSSKMMLLELQRPNFLFVDLFLILLFLPIH